MLTEDEACALVYSYLDSEVALLPKSSTRLTLMNALAEARELSVAGYRGNGKWYVWALGRYGKSVDGKDK